MKISEHKDYKVILHDSKYNFEKLSGVIYSKKDYLVKKSITSKRKQYLLIDAIRNLYKRINFLQLNTDLVSGYLTEDEFIKEIESNENRYVITVNDVNFYFEAQVISDLVIAIDLKLDTGEVAELFGVTVESLDKFRVNHYLLD